MRGDTAVIDVGTDAAVRVKDMLSAVFAGEGKALDWVSSERNSLKELARRLENLKRLYPCCGSVEASPHLAQVLKVCGIEVH